MSEEWISLLQVAKQFDLPYSQLRGTDPNRPSRMVRDMIRAGVRHVRQARQGDNRVALFCREDAAEFIRQSTLFMTPSGKFMSWVPAKRNGVRPTTH